MLTFNPKVKSAMVFGEMVSAHMGSDVSLAMPKSNGKARQS